MQRGARSLCALSRESSVHQLGLAAGQARFRPIEGTSGSLLSKPDGFAGTTSNLTRWKSFYFIATELLAATTQRNPVGRANAREAAFSLERFWDCRDNRFLARVNRGAQHLARDVCPRRARARLGAALPARAILRSRAQTEKAVREQCRAERSWFSTPSRTLCSSLRPELHQMRAIGACGSAMARETHPLGQCNLVAVDIRNSHGACHSPRAFSGGPPQACTSVNFRLSHSPSKL
jgi:hypothetical protein